MALAFRAREIYDLVTYCGISILCSIFCEKLVHKKLALGWPIPKKLSVRVQST